MQMCRHSNSPLTGRYSCGDQPGAFIFTFSRQGTRITNLEEKLRDILVEMAAFKSSLVGVKQFVNY